jgi:hypothetical protein
VIWIDYAHNRWKAVEALERLCEVHPHITEDFDEEDRLAVVQIVCRALQEKAVRGDA